MAKMLYFSETVRTVPYNIVTENGITTVRRCNVVGKYNALIRGRNKEGILVDKLTWIDWDTFVWEIEEGD